MMRSKVANPLLLTTSICVLTISSTICTALAQDALAVAGNRTIIPAANIRDREALQVARAETVTPGGGPEDTGSNGVVTLEPVTVTADKVEKDKQDVPASVSVYDGYALDDVGADTLEDVVGRSPNISFYRTDSHTTYLIYRGIGGTTNMNKVWNINTDGVTLPYVGTGTLLDVERVEMLRGSQGALYGRNTHAGVVNLVTREPGDDFTFDGSAAYESYNTVKLSAAGGGPITDGLGFRLAVGYRSSDGYFENSFLDTDDGNDNEQYSARGKIVARPTDSDKITLSLTGDRFDGSFDSYVTGGGTTTTNNEPGYTDGHLAALSLTWEHQFEVAKLTSISSYSRSNYGFLHDWDFTSLDISTGEYDENFYTLAQEFRLEGQAGPDLDWLAGTFLMAEDLDTETTMRLGADAAAWGLPANTFMAQRSSIETRSAAVFGQMVYRPLPRLELTGRMRLDYESKSLDWRGFSDMSPTVDKSFDQSWFAVLPSASVAWLLSEDQRVYASYSKGYKAGDYNNVQLDPAVVTQAVDPEFATTYEIGYKGLLADSRLEINAAAFYIDWKDLQVETPISLGGALVYQKQNAAEAHSSGLELEMRARPASSWEVFGSASYLIDFKFDEFPNSSSGDLSGKKLPNANRFSVNAGTVYRHPMGLFASADMTVNGPKFFDEANAFEQDIYTLVNAKVGYEIDNLSVYLYGRNLLDEDYALSMFANAELAGEPRVFGVRAQVTF